MNNFQDEELLHLLFLTTRQKSKIRNVFANNMPTDIKLNKAQISKKFNQLDLLLLGFASCFCVSSRNNLSRIKDGANVMYQDDKKTKETHWNSLFSN